MHNNIIRGYHTAVCARWDTVAVNYVKETKQARRETGSYPYLNTTRLQVFSDLFSHFSTAIYLLLNSPGLFVLQYSLIDVFRQQKTCN